MLAIIFISKSCVTTVLDYCINTDRYTCSRFAPPVFQYLVEYFFLFTSLSFHFLPLSPFFILCHIYTFLIFFLIFYISRFSYCLPSFRSSFTFDSCFFSLSVINIFLNLEFSIHRKRFNRSCSFISVFILFYSFPFFPRDHFYTSPTFSHRMHSLSFALSIYINNYSRLISQTSITRRLP